MFQIWKCVTTALRNQPKLDFCVRAQHETMAERIWLPNVPSDPLHLPLLLFLRDAVRTVPAGCCSFGPCRTLPSEPQIKKRSRDKNKHGGWGDDIRLILGSWPKIQTALLSETALWSSSFIPSLCTSGCETTLPAGGRMGLWSELTRACISRRWEYEPSCK